MPAVNDDILVIEIDVRCPYIFWRDVDPRKSLDFAFVPIQSIIEPALYNNNGGGIEQLLRNMNAKSRELHPQAKFAKGRGF